jgi:Flp pilus assembly protein TadB
MAADGTLRAFPMLLTIVILLVVLVGLAVVVVLAVAIQRHQRKVRVHELERRFAEFLGEVGDILSPHTKEEP